MGMVICMEMMLVLVEDEEAANINGRGGKKGVGRVGKRTHVFLLFRGLRVIIKGVRFKCADENLRQQGALWQHGEDWTLTTLRHVPNSERYKGAGGKEAAVFLSQAILLPSIFISESVAH